MNDTRQRILDTALLLFSQRGFSAVSIRDICAEVHIKESSVYYHFKNKRAIFDELLLLFEQRAERMMGQLERAVGGQPEANGDTLYCRTCEVFFEDYLMDGFCNSVLRLLLIEQHGSAEAGQVLDRWMFEVPLSFQSSVFSSLISQGLLRDTDSGYLAVRFYAPIYMFAQRWLFTGELTPERKRAFRDAAYRHVEAFFMEMGAIK